MARHVIDAFTLLHLVDNALTVDRSHQLVAPNIIRSEVLQLLLRDVRQGGRTDRAALEVHERKHDPGYQQDPADSPGWVRIRHAAWPG